MVAGDTKKIIVIKNISSNLIEEAILILKNDPGSKTDEQNEKSTQCGSNAGNDYILKEAESIINQYIRENGLAVTTRKHRRSGLKLFRFGIPVNALINCLLMAAVLFLILIICRVV
jgi:hypothetical protein